MKNVKVQNMRSNSSNKEVANQFIITTDEGRYFQSYNSIIAYKPHDNGAYDEEGVLGVLLDETYWDYSTTTGKYRNQFLGEDKATTQRKINSGEYLLADLNA